jgi:hypothetical protein
MLGNKKEPVLLQAHILGRGNVYYSYIGGCLLNGPQLGYQFDLLDTRSYEDEEDKNHIKYIFQALAERQYNNNKQLRFELPHYGFHKKIKNSNITKVLICRSGDGEKEFNTLFKNRFYISEKFLGGVLLGSILLTGTWAFFKYAKFK